MTRHTAHQDGPAPLVSGVAGGVTLAVLAVAFSLHALDVAWAWVVYPLGLGGFLPVALGWAKRAAERRTAPETADLEAETLYRLREQYAAGELEETEFERRVESVLDPTTDPEPRG